MPSQDQSHDEVTSTDKPAHAAGGWGALISTMKHVGAQEGKMQIALSLLNVNQADGFDCPGCAWPEPKDRSSFEFCENGAKAVAWEATKRKVGPEFLAQYDVATLRQQTDYWLEKQGRLTHPMRYNSETDRYEPISWDDAFGLIAEHLNKLESPKEAIFYTSGRTSNEAAFLYQLFGRKFGTNNFPDCSNMCHESSGVALNKAIGVGKGTVTIEDFEEADMIVVVGQNPGTNHPRMLSELQKASKRGAKIVSINPLKERGLENFVHPQHKVAMLTNHSTPISSHYLQPTIAGDLALFKGLCKLVVDAEGADPGKVLDHDFIKQHTEGFEEFIDDVKQSSWDDIEKQSGLTRAEIETVADLYLASDKVIICWAMGLTQQRHGVATIQMAVNLLLLRGNLGKPGAGACPVRGHSNVQGDRTMGIIEKPPPFQDKLAEVFNFEPPTSHGYDVVKAIHAMRMGKGKVFFAMGGNFAAATPDSEATYAALETCDLTVHVSTKLNRSHTVVGKDALILPCLGRTERDETGAGNQRVTVEDSMSMVHASEGKNPPASEHLLSEPAIVCRLARATFGPDDPTPWEDFAEDYGTVRDKIAAVIPGFENFNDKLNLKQYPNGFYLGNTARDRVWVNAGKKAAFTVSPIHDMTLPDGQLKLMTLRSHDQYNTTVYGLNDRYRDIENAREILFVNADDLAERGLTNGDLVDIESHFNDDTVRKVAGFRVVAYDIPRGCSAGYFPELNPLVSLKSVAVGSNTPVSKLIPITLAQAEG
ncbi:FdhF/YdeP family oxidoreductase [Algisphaera agarilytica]|uniref:Molybdopterin-dependent oxidoreductase alpha subunit n=1 Tax=Algisphaera agarilytica TaxID=1385975 RepID=A0A7X0HAS0_9BACT|nr:FdhF/YdeP family oxidoreductase [Algisphaera agarilytica]MBB6430959.1 molybdopterin-dependent oxidoreductase alpha subunit [Algisphaera agarilytica]